MALTWKKRKNGRRRKNNPLTKTDALAARRVLRDTYRARHDLVAAFQTNDASVCRLRWVTVITLLRIVGHALQNIDQRRSPNIKKSVNDAWHRWNKNRHQNLIFFEFIKGERDLLLKEYRFSVSSTNYDDMPSKALDGSPLILVGDKTYSAVEAVDAAIAWWEAELERVEIESEDAHPVHTTQEATALSHKP